VVAPVGVAACQKLVVGRVREVRCIGRHHRLFGPDG
jgi:hypothetical protein